LIPWKYKKIAIPGATTPHPNLQWIPLISRIYKES